MTEQFRKFLKNLYDVLYKKEIITKKASTSKEKLEIVLDYIQKLEKIQSKSSDSEEYLRRIKELYYRKYIIKESDIPDSYFEHLSERYLDEGHGHFDLVNPKNNAEMNLRKQHVSEIINNQKASLDAWLDYLMSEESNYIPMWAKLWAFQGMLDIGMLNKELNGYNRRDEKTIAPFVNIDSEILGKSVEYLKIHLGLSEEEYPDNEIKRLVSTESFYQIYGKLLASTKKIKLNGNEGLWKKYNDGSESDALKLFNDLQGYNTGWCTASSKETAKKQVCGGGAYLGGNFYVYYTKDENNEYKIPRLAIRMDKDKIGEIRGISTNQNIESDMEEVLDIKLKEFPDSKIYMKKVSNMRMLTEIYKKYKTEELTKEELVFLYELKENIDGFGYQKDPRIEEIKRTRSIKKDLAKALGCKEENIGISPESIENRKIVCYWGDLKLYTLSQGKDIALPEIIIGSLYLNSLENAEGLVFPKSIKGSLILNSLENIKGIKLPESIGGDLYFASIDIDDLFFVQMPDIVGGKIVIPKFKGSLLSSEYTLEELKRSIAIKKEKMDLGNQITEINENSKTNLMDFYGVQIYLKKVRNMRKISKIYKNYKKGLTMEELKFVYAIGYELEDFNYDNDSRIREILKERYIRSDLAEIFDCSENEILLEQESLDKGMKVVCYYGNLNLYYIKDNIEINLPKYVKGDLDLCMLTTAKDLVFPEVIVGNLYLNSLRCAENLIFPKIIKRNVCLNRLESIKTILLPDYIGESLYLTSLSIEDLLFVQMPKSVGGEIVLSNERYTLEKLKQAVAIKKEKMNLNNQKEVLESYQIQDNNIKRGSINIWYILIPSLTLLLGVVLASLIVK